MLTSTERLHFTDPAAILATIATLWTERGSFARTDAYKALRNELVAPSVLRSGAWRWREDDVDLEVGLFRNADGTVDLDMWRSYEAEDGIDVEGAVMTRVAVIDWRAA